MKTKKKDIVLYSLKTRFFKDRKKALKTIGEIKKVYGNDLGIIIKRDTRTHTEFKNNQLKTTYPEYFILW